MKKTMSILLGLSLLVLLFAGCAGGANDATATPAASVEPTAAATPTPAPATETPAPTEEPVTIRLGGLKGATSIGMVKLLSDSEEGLSANQYEYTLAGSADELTPKLVQGELDIAAVPVNLGSILWNNTSGAVQMLAVNTLGVVYIVEKGGEQVQSMADLKGMTVFATGKGSTPEYALNYLLAQNGIDPAADLTIEWKSEPSEVLALMSTMDHAVAMMPQPYVTIAQGQLPDLRVAVDMTKAWDSLGNGSMFITAGLVVRTAFAEQYPQQLEAFLEEYKASTAYANEDVAGTAALVEHFGIFKAAVAEKAIPACNITYIDGSEMKTALSGYLQILFDQNPKAVGGAMPGDGFYYGA
jgi:NitT/TauT family transport system substrate-binding protein